MGDESALNRDSLPDPNMDFSPQDVIALCMNHLLWSRDEGLEVCFNFSSDRCRAAQGGSLEAFREYAQNPVFAFLVNCDEWNIISMGPVINATNTRGSMQTMLMEAVQHKMGDSSTTTEARKFLWTFQQERRPPRQGCWLVHEVIYEHNAFQLTL